MVDIVGFSLVLVSTIFGALGALFLKKGAANFNFSVIKQLKNWEMILGLFFFATGILVLIAALRLDELSALYPITSLSYIWISFLSMRFLGEKINSYRWLGIIMIVLGVSLVTL